LLPMVHLLEHQALALCLATQLFNACRVGTNAQEAFELADKQVTEADGYSQVPVTLGIDTN